MLEKIVAAAFAAIAIVALGIIAVARIRMIRSDYFEKIQAGTNANTNQLQQFIKAPPRWIALLLLIAGIAITALNLAIIRHAVQSGYIAIRDVRYSEVHTPMQFWLHVGQSGCIAGLTAIIALWSLGMLFRRGGNHHN